VPAGGRLQQQQQSEAHQHGERELPQAWAPPAPAAVLPPPTTQGLEATAGEAAVAAAAAVAGAQAAGATEAEDTEEEEGRETGHVKARVYGAYAQAAGPVMVALILLSFVCMQARAPALSPSSLPCEMAMLSCTCKKCNFPLP
jgi:hypothetical protein